MMIKNRLMPLLAAMLVTVILAGCKQNTPENTAETFLTSFYHMEYQKAREVSTEKTIQLINLMEQFTTNYPDSVKQNAKKIKVDILEVKEQGDEAVAVYTLSNDPAEQRLKMVKQNGEWLVDDSKEDADTGTEEEEEAIEEPATGPDSAAAM